MVFWAQFQYLARAAQARQRRISHLWQPSKISSSPSASFRRWRAHRWAHWRSGSEMRALQWLPCRLASAGSIGVSTCAHPDCDCAMRILSALRSPQDMPNALLCRKVADHRDKQHQDDESSDPTRPSASGHDTPRLGHPFLVPSLALAARPGPLAVFLRVCPDPPRLGERGTWGEAKLFDRGGAARSHSRGHGRLSINLPRGKAASSSWRPRAFGLPKSSWSRDCWAARKRGLIFSLEKILRKIRYRSIQGPSDLE